MENIPHIFGHSDKAVHWFFQHGDVAFVCSCSQTTIIPIDTVLPGGEVLFGMHCNKCGTSRSIRLIDFGGDNEAVQNE